MTKKKMTDDDAVARCKSCETAYFYSDEGLPPSEYNCPQCGESLCRTTRLYKGEFLPLELEDGQVESIKNELKELTQNKSFKQMQILIETFGLKKTLALAKVVCLEKAEFITKNYGDKSLAEIWKKDGNKIAALNVEVS